MLSFTHTPPGSATISSLLPHITEYVLAGFSKAGGVKTTSTFHALKDCPGVKKGRFDIAVNGENVAYASRDEFQEVAERIIDECVGGVIKACEPPYISVGVTLSYGFGNGSFRPCIVCEWAVKPDVEGARKNKTAKLKGRTHRLLVRRGRPSISDCVFCK